MPPATNTPTFVPAIPALMGLGMSRGSAYKFLNGGALPATKMLGKTMVRADDLAAFERGLPAYPVKKGRPKKANADIAPWDIELPGEKMRRTEPDAWPKDHATLARLRDEMRLQPYFSPLQVE